MTRRNPTLDALRSGAADACAWLLLGAPAIAELAVTSGLATVVFDLQHGLWDRASLEAGIGAVRTTGTPLVRVAENTPFAIGSALDAGAVGVIVPLVDTAEQARAAVAAARYPPHGNRSTGGVRPLEDFAAYQRFAERGILVAVMIETAAAVAAVDAIAAVPGVDLLFVGPSDLGLSLAAERRPASAFEDAVARVLAAGRAHGVPVGIFTPDAESARRRIDQGFRFVAASNDLGALRAGFTAAAARTGSA